MFHRAIEVSGHQVFYREAGNPQRPTLLLLHGFPTSSHMFRDLIPLLSDQYHVVAPDLPGFGFTQSPKGFRYSFDGLAEVIGGVVDTLRVKRYALFLFYYRAPGGVRPGPAQPGRGGGVISPNRNA